jgi:uncharacterized protein (TIGR02452 family)
MNNNWREKEKRAEQARIHTAQMTQYNDQTNLTIGNSKIYSPDSVIVPNIKYDERLVRVDAADSVSAAFHEKYYGKNSGKICILNFASYKNPGGRFIDGSFAQEEALCHASNLYNVLGAFSGYYEENRKKLNKGMYLNRAIYSPEVLFFGGHARIDLPTAIPSGLLMVPFDVLTCAAPNFSVARRYGNFTKEENSEALRSRIRFILSIMSENQVDTAILGAFGCGVFAQDPYEVATVFKEELQNIPIRNAIFAIPGGINLEAFRKVLK